MISISVCYRYVKRCVGVFLLVDLWGFPFTTIKFGVYENTSSMLAQRGLSCKMCFYSSYLKVRALILFVMIISIVNRTISTKFQEILNELYFAILYCNCEIYSNFYSLLGYVTSQIFISHLCGKSPNRLLLCEL